MPPTLSRLGFSLRPLFAFLALLLIPCPDTAAEEKSIVVIVSVDGLAGFYLDDPKAELTHLRQIAAEGARAEKMKVSLPSVTWVNHTTLITGVPPAIHGVNGNRDFDRETRSVRIFIGDPDFDKAEIVKVPTLYDIAHENGLKTVGIRWPASRNVKTLDWTVPSVRDAQKAEPFTTPSLLEEAAKATGFDFSQKRDDTWRTTLFKYILSTHHPQFAILHLSETDGIQHRHGPRSPEAYQAIKEADDRLGDLWEFLKKEYSDRATLFIVSDHGFSPVDFQIRPNVALRKAGLLAEKLEDSDIRIVSAGGSAAVYILDEKNRDSLLAKVRKELQGLEGLSRILETSDFSDYGVATPEQSQYGPDLYLLADEGYGFNLVDKGEETVVKTKKRTGAHGHDPALPNLHGTFVAWGAGIKPGTTLGIINNTRVAPTAAKVLGLSLPAPADAPLSEILEEN